MSATQVRLPIVHKDLFHRSVLEVELPVKLKTNVGWPLLMCLFDTGSDFTSIPMSWAEQFSLPFETTHPVSVHGTTGSGVGYLCPLTWCFPDIPHLEFESICCVNPGLKRPLFCLTDVLTHLTIR